MSGDAGGTGPVDPLLSISLIHRRAKQLLGDSRAPEQFVLGSGAGSRGREQLDATHWG